MKVESCIYAAYTTGLNPGEAKNCNSFTISRLLDLSFE